MRFEIIPQSPSPEVPSPPDEAQLVAAGGPGRRLPIRQRVERTGEIMRKDLDPSGRDNSRSRLREGTKPDTRTRNRELGRVFEGGVIERAPERNRINGYKPETWETLDLALSRPRLEEINALDSRQGLLFRTLLEEGMRKTELDPSHPDYLRKDQLKDWIDESLRVVKDPKYRLPTQTPNREINERISQPPSRLVLGTYVAQPGSTSSLVPTGRDAPRRFSELTQVPREAQRGGQSRPANDVIMTPATREALIKGGARAEQIDAFMAQIRAFGEVQVTPAQLAQGQQAFDNLRNS
jgi:hypothetical protein